MLKIEAGSDYTVYHQVLCHSLHFCSLFGNITTSNKYHLDFYNKASKTASLKQKKN